MMIPITFLSTWYRRNIHNTYCPKWSWSLGYCVMVYCLWKHTRRIHLIWWPIKKQVGHMLTFTSIVKVIQLILNYPPNWCLWFIFWFHLCQLTWIRVWRYPEFFPVPVHFSGTNFFPGLVPVLFSGTYFFWDRSWYFFSGLVPILFFGTGTDTFLLRSLWVFEEKTEAEQLW